MTAILGWGFVGKQVRPSLIAILVSSSVVIAASVGREVPLCDASAVSEWVASSDEELADSESLTTLEEDPDVAEFGNCASVFGCYGPNPPYFDADLEADALEYRTLLASLSPGVRANYRVWLRDRADARAKEREREAAEHERDEAAYAVFIEEHLRRLYEERSSRE